MLTNRFRRFGSGERELHQHRREVELPGAVTESDDERRDELCTRPRWRGDDAVEPDPPGVSVDFGVATVFQYPSTPSM
ncbi:MAG: hypothetical protein QNM02_06690 [Acidimicrobiia bacterium]|nr:hypothetical protein [Acidimicrobiia bacterium]